MSYRSLSRAVALLPIALVAACTPDRDVTAPETARSPGTPSFTVVDPGAEVNTTIAITQGALTEAEAELLTALAGDLM